MEITRWDSGLLVEITRDGTVDYWWEIGITGAGRVVYILYVPWCVGGCLHMYGWILRDRDGGCDWMVCTGGVWHLVSVEPLLCALLLVSDDDIKQVSFSSPPCGGVSYSGPQAACSRPTHRQTKASTCHPPAHHRTSFQSIGRFIDVVV